MDSNKTVEKLIKENQMLCKCLIDVITSCAHPSIAIRCISVDLKPIRAILKEIIGENKDLGIS